MDNALNRLRDVAPPEAIGKMESELIRMLEARATSPATMTRADLQLATTAALLIGLVVGAVPSARPDSVSLMALDDAREFAPSTLLLGR